MLRTPPMVPSTRTKFKRKTRNLCFFSTLYVALPNEKVLKQIESSLCLLSYHLWLLREKNTNE